MFHNSKQKLKKKKKKQATGIYLSLNFVLHFQISVRKYTQINETGRSLEMVMLPQSSDTNTYRCIIAVDDEDTRRHYQGIQRKNLTVFPGVHVK